MNTSYEDLQRAPQDRQLRESGPARGGFTVIELLVVIVMIALGALMLIPTLARTSPSENTWHCINNLKHWSLAAVMYASDNADGLPRDGMGENGLYPGANGGSRNTTAWFNRLPEYMAEKPLSYYTDNAVGDAVTNSHILPFPGGVGQIWQCPSAHMSAGDLANLAGGGAEGFFSYVFNIDLKKATASVNMAYPFMPKLATLQKPAATVLMTDAVFSSDEGFTAGNNYYSVNPAGRWRLFPNRHNKEAGVLAFCDGHTAYFKRAKIIAEQNGYEPLLSDVIWNPPYRLANP